MSTPIPITSGVELTEVEAKVARAIATRRFEILRRELDRSEPVRDELRAAGINESTISTLYPLNLADWIDGLQALMTPHSLHKVNVLDELNRLGGKAKTIMQLLSSLLSLLEDQETPELLTRQRGLKQQIADSISHDAHDEATREQLGAQISAILLLAITLMDSYAQYSMACDFFKAATDLLLPHLRAAEAKEITALASGTHPLQQGAKAWQVAQ